MPTPEAAEAPPTAEVAPAAVAATAPPRHAPTATVLFGLKTRPAGAGLTASLMVPVVQTRAFDLQVGPYAALYYYWYEADAQVRARLYGGLAVLTLQGGAEPGGYLPLDTERTGERGWSARDFSLRGLGRGTLELNVRNDHFWVYTRTLGLVRGHPFAEYDPYRDLSLDGTEASGEQALAAMIAPLVRHRTPSGRAPYTAYGWVYGEVIADGIAAGTVDRGATDTSAHLGVILEQVVPHLYVDLDGYWSFGPSARLEGPGALVVFTWVRGPAGG